MKKNIFFGLAVVSVITTAAVSIIACKRNVEKFDARGAYASERIPSCEACDSVGTKTISGVISANRQLSCDTVYLIDGKVFVNPGATLTIPPGTVIKFKKYADPSNASALIITKGAKIDARGDQACPILFTSELPFSQARPGDWGGIVLLGTATVNQGNAGIIEGIQTPSVPAGVDITYGGSTDSDSSGVMTYCRIEFAGAAIATDNELNGLTCGGVGNKTVLDFIEVYRGNDDAFEFFGGTVRAKHLVAFEPDDDAFDFDFGFKGSVQFAVSILANDTTRYSANPNGIESDNDATGSGLTPLTQATLSNLTVIGVSRRDSAIAKGLLNGAIFRRNSDLLVRNSIFMGFPTGLNLQSVGTQADSANFQYNLVHAFDSTAKGNSPNIGDIILLNCSQYVNANPNASILLANPFNYSALDFRPATGSPALSGSNFTGLPAWFTTTTYRGAFGTTNWMYGWTRTPTVL